MLRRHPLPCSAPPAPSDTTSAAPIRMPGTRPPGNPQSNAPGRIATSVRSRGAGTPEPRASAPASVLSMRLPLGQPAIQDTSSGPSPTAATRPATGRRRRTPRSRAPRTPPTPATGTRTTPTAAAGLPPATRPRTARPSPPGSGTVSRRRRRSRDRPSRRAAATGTPPPQTAPATVAPRPPRPPSPDGTRCHRPPRSRTTHGRDPPRASDVQASFHSARQSRSRPAPSCRSAPPECSQPANHGPGPRDLFTSFRSTPPASRHRARRAARRPAPRPRRVRPARSAPARMRPTTNRNVIVSPSGSVAR